MTETRFNIALIVVLTILAAIIITILSITCSAENPQTESNIVTTNQSTDGWILIGNKNNCQIYYRDIQIGPVRHDVVFWTICNDDISSQSSVAVN